MLSTYVLIPQNVFLYHFEQDWVKRYACEIVHVILLQYCVVPILYCSIYDCCGVSFSCQRAATVRILATKNICFSLKFQMDLYLQIMRISEEIIFFGLFFILF